MFRSFFQNWLRPFSLLAILLLSTDDTLFSLLSISKGLLYSADLTDYLLITYTAGIATGSILWYVTIEYLTVRGTTFLTQIGLILTTTSLLFFKAPIFLLSGKFLQGCFVAGPAICLNSFAKNSLKIVEFKHFLTFTQILPSVIEGFIPMIAIFFTNKFGRIILAAFPLAYILIGTPCIFYVNNKSGPDAKDISKSFKGYLSILSSILIMPLLIIGCTNGIIEMFVFHATSNIETLSKLYPFISIGSFVVINLITYMSKHTEIQSPGLFNWKAGIDNDNRRQFGIAILLLMASLLCLLQLNEDARLMFIAVSTILITSVNVINYLAVKKLYCICHNSACVASLVILIENIVSCVIQFGYKYLTANESLAELIQYLLFFSIAILILTLAFYSTLMAKHR